MTERFAFDRFELDSGDRRLRADGAPVELNGRYFDALALMVREPGRLVSKDRFLDDVWSGVPVTDEALTQCIKTLRRALGDEAGNPRFIETVPKHGYRFIAPVRALDGGSSPHTPRASPTDWGDFLRTGIAGTAGAAVAGAVGGLIYGFAAASAASVGAISALLVLLSVTLLVAVIGGAGVSFAIAAAMFARRRSLPWLALAGAAGGLFVGAFGNLLGHDSFALLVGRAPGAITGGMEGAILGAAVGTSAWFAERSASPQRAAMIAALVGAATGVIIVLLGGRMMLGSLEQLGQAFPHSSLRLDGVRLGPSSDFAAAGLEAALFSGCLVGAMALARRGSRPD